MVDLQLLTVFRFLRTELKSCRGRVLDVGAGESPWRELLREVEYIGIDVEKADQFGMRRKPDIIYYSGDAIPLPDSSVDHILCSEVLEHVPNALVFLTDLARVLRSGGSMVLTVPWSARLHHLPHDYSRFTNHGLHALMAHAGFTDVRIAERGNNVAVIANKLLVMTINLIRPQRAANRFWSWPLTLLLTPVAAAFLVAAHISMALNSGGKDDPLGYGVVAFKR